MAAQRLELLVERAQHHRAASAARLRSVDLLCRLSQSGAGKAILPPSCILPYYVCCDIFELVFVVSDVMCSLKKRFLNSNRQIFGIIYGLAAFTYIVTCSINPTFKAIKKKMSQVRVLIKVWNACFTLICHFFGS